MMHLCCRFVSRSTWLVVSVRQGIEIGEWVRILCLNDMRMFWTKIVGCKWITTECTYMYFIDGLLYYLYPKACAKQLYELCLILETWLASMIIWLQTMMYKMTSLFKFTCLVENIKFIPAMKLETISNCLKWHKTQSPGRNILAILPLAEFTIGHITIVITLAGRNMIGIFPCHMDMPMAIKRFWCWLWGWFCPYVVLYEQ